VRLRLAWITVVVSIIGWPLSALTWAANEPQFVLALSWLALTITALDVLSTSDVSADVSNAEQVVSDSAEIEHADVVIEES
jgi:hypothetical protein